jgi:hypothetical protein
MKKILIKNLKGLVTSGIGLTIWVVSLYMWMFKAMPILWEGIAAFVVGGVFFLIPDDILTVYIKKYLDKKVE